MKIEVLQNDEGYIYLEKDEEYKFPYPIVSRETLGNLNIYSVKELICTVKKDKKEDIFKCRHGCDLIYKSLNLLPSEDWQELIECWSCHNNEFASVKDLKIKVRPEGILVSSFFLLINNIDLPECCRNEEQVRKIWFNELENVNHEQKVFEYLKTHFKSNNLFIFQYKDKIYEIKYFYTCKSVIIEDHRYSNVMKIGFKEKPDFYYKPTKDEFINKFYLELIYERIHLLEIEIFDYKAGFIFY